MILSSLSLNFKKVLSNFNIIEFLDLEKSQKALNENFSQYKLTSEGQFTTINEVL
jgi:hypothetical protein